MNLRGIVLGLVLLYAGYYAVLAFAIPLPLVLNGVLDDSFYYLQVARNVARGLGSTFDGVELTNGYHPLWMWLLVPLHWLSGPDPETAVRLALGLSGLLAIGSLLLIRRIHTRVSGRWAAAVALLLFAWPRFFGQTVNLLETGLLLLLYLAAANLGATGGRSGFRRSTALGVLLGLAALARLDTIFLWGAVAAFGFWRGIRGERLLGASPGLRGTTPPPLDRHRGVPALVAANLWPLVPAFVLLAPYLTSNLLTYGHILPVSGSIKTTFPRPDPHWGVLREFPEFTVLLVLGVLFAAAALRSRASRMVRVVGLFGLAGLLHMIYTILFMTWGVDRWHFGLLIPVAILGIPWLVHRILGLFFFGQRSWIRPAVLVVGLLTAVTVQAISLHARGGRHLAATREVALWARDHLPDESVYAMSDAGVFAYFSQRVTVNLDGLINSYAYLDDLRNGRVRDYLRRRGVDYIFEQYNYGRPDWIQGDYETRIMRFWYRPESRVSDAITLWRKDEVYRRNLASRPAALRPVAANALILYRYRPEAQETTAP